MSSVDSTETDFVWTPRRQITLAQARRRSAVVRVLRVAFTACAAISLGVLAGPVMANAVSGFGDARRSYDGSEIVTMLNPRFTGRDASGDQYVITADTAQRRRAAEGVIDLTNPTLVDEKGVRITAPEGTYDQDSQTLDLFRDVRVSDQGGYRFFTTSARFHITEGRIEGREPLRGEGPLGDIRSDTYEITQDGDVVNFRGNVEMIFNEPGADDTGSTSTAPSPGASDEDANDDEG